MNILFCSLPFHPSVGGIETVSAILAEQFCLQGHRVVLVTETAGSDAEQKLYEVVRQPDWRRLWSLVRQADVVFHNNISLRLAWPLLVLRRPWVIAHHTWIPRSGSGRLKRLVMRMARRNITVSRAMAADLPVPCTVLPNPYRNQLFGKSNRPGHERSLDIVFLGRLVSDKGGDILVDAVHRLRERGWHLQVTLIGDGPEKAALQAKVDTLGLGPRFKFAGTLVGEELVTVLNRHRFLVVPSLWEEPFGLVALEGLACGCVPVVAQSGGLPDAVGACGKVFNKGDATALADTLQALLSDPAGCARLLQGRSEHLARHRPERVALAYLDLLEDACRNGRTALAA
jgi:glycogen synthase